MLRSFAVVAAVAALGLALVTTEASARGPGGFRGGFQGFRGGPSMAFRGGPAFRAGPGFAGPGFNRGFVNRGFAGPGFAGRRFGPGFRRFGYVGLPLVGAYAGYGYYNRCVVPQTVATPWGYRTQWINVCDDDYLY